MLTSVASAGPAFAKGVTTRYVDDDGHAGARGGCRGSGHAFKRIQIAVDNSGPGDRILVCPGVYRGLIVIEGPAKHGLSIQAVERWRSDVRPPRSTGGALIVIARVDGVLIEGLQLRAPTHGSCRPVYSMIRVHNANASIRSNRIAPVGTDTIGPCGYGNGVRVSGTSSAWIGENVIQDFTRYGVFVDGSELGPYPEAAVIGNHIRYYHAGEAALAPGGGGVDSDQAGTRVVGNVIGSLATARPSGAGGTPLLASGIFVFTSGSARGNHIHDVGTGLTAIDGAGPLWRNTIRNSRFDGIWVDFGGTQIVHNTVLGSGSRGIVAGPDSAPLARGNTVLGSGDFDCVDVGGSGIWINNIGEKSDPPGLCTPPSD
jgi:hypothetical protein